VGRCWSACRWGDAGGYKADDMWGQDRGPEQRVEAQRPDGSKNVRTLVAKQHPPLGSTAVTASRPSWTAGMSSGNLFNAKFLRGLSHCGRNKTFQGQLHRRGRAKNGVFQLPVRVAPTNGNYWGCTVWQQMKPGHPAGARRDGRKPSGNLRLPRRPASETAGLSGQKSICVGRAAGPPRGSPPSVVSGRAPFQVSPYVSSRAL